ncbi:MAG: hypothetical protein ACREPI_07055 [Candidatus Dormibacterales bacterium]
MSEPRSDTQPGESRFHRGLRRFLVDRPGLSPDPPAAPAPPEAAEMAAAAPVLPTAEHAPCAWSGCHATEVWRCGYVDQHGSRCGLWCREHITFVEQAPLCRRHANVVRHVSAQAGSIYEIKTQVAIDDRGPSLVSMVVEEADAGVRAALERTFAAADGFQVTTDPAIRLSRVPEGRLMTEGGRVTFERLGSEQGWSRGWGVYTSSGYVWRALVSSTHGEPPLVVAQVNHQVIFAGVPDWIGARGQRPNQELHEAFSRRLVAALTRSV